MRSTLLSLACLSFASLATSLSLHSPASFFPHHPLSFAVQQEKEAKRLGVKPGIENYHTGNYQYSWKEQWYQAYVDNYNYNMMSSADTYPMRYLLNDTWWGGPSYPIFFYCGNEGFIELFANNTGFMWDIASQYKALIVFAEHRYYGLSMPFGDNSYDINNLAYLTAEQALADYAWMLMSLQTNLSATTAPVILFGGSYGGMLAAWSRIRNPTMSVGAIASSAPILQIPGIMDPKAYNHIVTNDFGRANSQAPQAIYNTWNAMFDLMNTQSGRDTIASTLNICGSLYTTDDVWNVIYWLSGAIGYMAMADYPYPANFLGPMPAFPCSVAAGYFTNPNGTPVELLQAMNLGVGQIFYNYTGQAGTCFNLSSSSPPGLQGDGWGVQCCKEVVQPIGSYGLPSDFFWPSPFNETAFIQGCQQQFNGTTPRANWAAVQYGGWNLAGVSNIVFANGELDPWYSGGIIKNVTGTYDVTAFIIEDGAHHLDLRSSNPADPPSVIEARNIEKAAISRWSNAHYERLGIDIRV